MLKKIVSAIICLSVSNFVFCEEDCVEVKRFSHCGGKLVRDKVLDDIKKHHSDAKIKYEYLKSDEYRVAILSKVVDEAKELRDSRDRAEMVLEIADVMECLEALMESEKISEQEVFDAKLAKKNRIGGLKTGLFIDWVQIGTPGKLYDYYLKDSEKYPEISIDDE